MKKIVFAVIFFINHFYLISQDSLKLDTSSFDNNNIACVVVISFDSNKTIYKMQFPNIVNSDRKIIYLRVTPSTSCTEEVYFEKDIDKLTDLVFLEPFVETIHFDNQYKYLFVQVKNNKIIKLIYSNEPRVFY